MTKTATENVISDKYGGLVPLRYWQKCFQLNMMPDVTAKYVVHKGSMTYINTAHPDYTRWFVGFVRGAAKATDDAIKRHTH